MSEPNQITGPTGETWARMLIGIDTTVHWVIMAEDGVSVRIVGVSLPVSGGSVNVSRIGVNEGVGIAQLIAILQAELRRVVNV